MIVRFFRFVYLFLSPVGSILLPVFLIAQITCSSQTKWIELKNQASGWGTIHFNDPAQYQLGVRYIPSISLSGKINKKWLVDSEISANTFIYGDIAGNLPDVIQKSLKPYRLWLRVSSNQFELRAGLQKINFGSASVLRPLMWFDQMDFRDPLQLTNGVYALLGRYYFKNNANVWLWVLRGNRNVKGWETFPAKKDKNEYGGRLQIPVFKGELAFSFHSRMADYSTLYAPMPQVMQTAFKEELRGLDGKFDIGPGIWFEFVSKKNSDKNIFVPRNEFYFNTGMDYTFKIGNGLTITSEYFRYSNVKTSVIPSIKNNFMALAASYPFGLLNTISGIVYYNFDTKNWYRFINIQRKYDFWSFYVMAFLNPENLGNGLSPGNKSLFAGKGIQLMTVVNF